MRVIVAIPVEGLPIVEPGDNLARLILEAVKRNGIELKNGDVIVVAQKVVSRAEGRIIKLDSVNPSEDARRLAKISGKDPRIVELILRESSKVLRVARGKIIVRSRLGHVCNNAGIDESNAGEGYVTLLPLDPDKSARMIREYLEKATNRRLAVIISDSSGRAFRRGVVGIAIGVSGLKPLLDLRGREDLFGRKLRSTIVAIADCLATLAVMAMGESNEGTPVVIVRGAAYERDLTSSSSMLNFSEEEDLFV